MPLIDLTAPLREVEHDPDPDIKYYDHRRGAYLLGLAMLLYPESLWAKLKKAMKYLFGQERIGPKDFPDGIGLAFEKFTGDTHTGTHMDAPYHYGPVSSGQPAKTIEQIPLEWCIGDGVLLDVSSGPSGQEITREELKNALVKIDYSVKPLDIVLIRTGAAVFYGKPGYKTAHRGLSVEAVRWLVDQGVKVIGVDAFSFDRPFNEMEQAYFTTNDNKHLWPVHFLGRQVEYCQIENVGDLSILPVAKGFRLYCFPIPVQGASAGWVRLVAEVPISTGKIGWREKQ